MTSGDISIPRFEELGLIIPSKVRTAKINSVEVGGATRIGKLDNETWNRVLTQVRANLGV
jgi:hypothetical protein